MAGIFGAGNKDKITEKHVRRELNVSRAESSILKSQLVQTRLQVEELDEQLARLKAEMEIAKRKQVEGMKPRVRLGVSVTSSYQSPSSSPRKESTSLEVQECAMPEASSPQQYI